MQCIELVEQLRVTRKGCDKQIAEVKHVCEQHIAALDKRLAEKELVRAVTSVFIPIRVVPMFSLR